VADAISPQTLSDLIGSIYDCALDPARWEQTLPDVMEVLDCYGLILGLSDLRHHRLLIHKAIGFGLDHSERISKHLPEIDAILGGALASWPSLDEPWVVSRHLTTAHIETSPYLQECKGAGIVDMMQFFLVHEPMHFSGLGVGRNERQGIITEREIELGKLLLPHLRRAVAISKVVEVRTIAGVRMAEALDALRCGVVLTNERGTILHANRAAEHMLRDGGGPIRSADGTLQATAPSAASELHSALALAARNEAGIGKTGLAIRLTEPDVPPVFAHVLPLTGSDFRTRLQPPAVAAVFIGAAPEAQDGADAVAAAYGLTPAETRVLASLFAGRTLAEIAAMLGIAGTTAKTHLEHIFLKTGVTRQAELLRLWTGLISPTGSNR